MKVSDKGIAALIAHEGIIPAPYRDSVGVWTWGIGHTAAAGAPIPASMPKGMPQDLDAALRRVFAVFRDDLKRYAADVNRAVKVPMKQHEFDAAVSFHFNTGAIAKASWVKRWNAGDRKGAIRGIMSWSKPKEIIARRTAERNLFRDGKYPHARATVWGVSNSGRVIWKAVRTLNEAEMLELMREQTRPPVVDHIPTNPAEKKPWWEVLLGMFAR